jgi:hypothetical protein
MNNKERRLSVLRYIVPRRPNPQCSCLRQSDTLPTYPKHLSASGSQGHDNASMEVTHPLASGITVGHPCQRRPTPGRISPRPTQEHNPKTAEAGAAQRYGTRSPKGLAQQRGKSKDGGTGHRSAGPPEGCHTERRRG